MDREIEKNNALKVDLYELTMAAVYYDRQMTETATFSLFARDLPQRNFYVAAGLEDALETLENYRSLIVFRI